MPPASFTTEFAGETTSEVPGKVSRLIAQLAYLTGDLQLSVHVALVPILQTMHIATTESRNVDGDPEACDQEKIRLVQLRNAVEEPQLQGFGFRAQAYGPDRRPGTRVRPNQCRNQEPRLRLARV